MTGEWILLVQLKLDPKAQNQSVVLSFVIGSDLGYLREDLSRAIVRMLVFSGSL